MILLSLIYLVLPCTLFLPKDVVLISEFSLNLLELTISDWIPSYMSKYSSCKFCGTVPKSQFL